MRFPRSGFAAKALMLCLLLAGALVLKGSGGAVGADSENIYKNLELLSEVLREIERNYVEPQDPQKLIYGAIKGMVQSLDPHSSFMTKDEHQELMLETKGSFTGIGIEITIRDQVLTVVAPIEGTPADKAGLQAGDKIVKVEGKSTKDMTLMEAVKLIRGPKGSEVRLTIVRKGEETPLEFSIVRDVIPLKSVRYHVVAPGIGYVRISNFQSKTAEQLGSALDALEEKGALKGLILDLRNNPGGLLSQAIEVAEFFLDSGVIVSTKGRHKQQNITAKAHKNKKPQSYPMIVLINGGSASASEIVAGALQDNKRALILGTRSFGKGSVQTILSLSDGSGLRLTTARYYTPSGRSIQLDGIHPDIELAFVPPDREKAEQKRRFMREEDLARHMPKEGVSKEEPETEQERDERVKQLLERDNQLRHAVQLLQSWEIFSRMHAAP